MLYVGGLLVACAHFGAYVVGADIDYKLLHGIGLSNVYHLSVPLV